MRAFTHKLMLATALGSIGVLSACDHEDSPGQVMTPPPAPTPTPTPVPTPTPSPTPAPTSFNVQPCLDQMIPGTGTTVAGAVVPDTLTLNLAAASGFPNGRRLADPVIDVTLNVIFLNLAANGPGTLAGVPVNPPANDQPFRASFPYLAAAQGTPPAADTSGTTFNFRTDDASAFVRVDRMGMPAVATALIGTNRKNAYNDANPSDDAAGTFVPDLGGELTTLTNALADDLIGLGLTPCARPS
ncbi:DUF4331 family protein [Sphingomonas sp. CJ99]